MWSSLEAAIRRGQLDGVLLAAATLVLRALYVFGATDYSTYLKSDMEGYWTRAVARLAGGAFDHDQWALSPPLYHIILAEWLRALRGLGIDERNWLEGVLLLQIGLAAIAVIFAHALSRRLLGHRTLALAVTALFAFGFPFVYLNALILSENVAIPLAAIATCVLLLYPENAVRTALGGIALGLAIGVRPALALTALPLIWFVLASGGARRWVQAAAFTAALSVVLAAVILEVTVISGGAVVGLSANGGLNFYMAQCKVARFRTEYEYLGKSFKGGIEHPQYDGEEWRKSVSTNRKWFDQAAFYREGCECLANPYTWLEDAWELRKLFFGHSFPVFRSARGYEVLTPFFRYFFGALALAALALPPLLMSAGHRPSDEVLALWGTVAATVTMSYFFGNEGRFLYPACLSSFVLLPSLHLSIPRTEADPVP